MLSRSKEVLLSDSRVHIFVITLLFLVTRTIFLFTPAGQLGDADQAVFGMMAQKIALLDEFPLVCWEAHYGGAPVTYIAAIFFSFFGAGYVQLRVAMILIIFPGLVLFYFIYQRIFDSQRAFIGVLFLIFCPYLVLNCTTGGGGYGESFLGAALIILLSWKIRDQSMSIPIGASCFLLGLTCGFFTYIQFFVVPAVVAFAIPALLSLGKNRIKSFWRFSLGGLIGISPLIIYNFMTGGGTLTRGAAWVLLIGREDISAGPMNVIGNIILQKSAYLTSWLSNAPLMFGQYVMPAILGHTLQIAAGLILIVILFVYIVSSLTKGKKKEAAVAFYHRQFALYLLIFILFHLFASLRADRHLMPLFAVIPVALLGVATWHPMVKKVSIALILVLSTLQVISWNQEFRTPHFDPNPVAKIMGSQGIREFYSSYWTAYPIMFLGEGRLVGSPMLLPFNEPFSDRRPQYTEQVRRSRDAAFVFGVGEELLEKKFLSFLKTNDITYKMQEIDGTTIYYGLSTPVAVSFTKSNRQNFFFLKYQS